MPVWNASSSESLPSGTARTWTGENGRRHELLLLLTLRDRTGRACLYVTRLENIDLDVLEDLVRESVETMHRIYG